MADSVSQNPDGTVTDISLADLQVELAEINGQLHEMVGSPSFNVSGFSVDESKLQKDLMERKVSLEWRISNMVNNPNATVSDNMRIMRASTGR